MVVVRIVARNSLFVLDNDDASPFSGSGAIKQRSASVNVFLQFLRGEVMWDDSRSFRVLAFLAKGTTNDFP